ncbi:MAG: class I SAM-dependent methyltransferase family protein [Candidatus Woesearchaeota archaeon]
MVLAIKVDKKNAQKVKKDLLEKNIINLDYKMNSEKDFVYFPVLTEYKNYEILNKKFEKNKTKPIKLSEIFQKILPKSKIDLSKRSYDLIGDIAIVEFEDGIEKYEKRIAEELLKSNKKIKVVAKKPKKITGKYRIRKIEVLAGEKRTITEYREAGCRFIFDLNKTYFSQRLGKERLRIANLVKPNEKILVMFSGISPFGIVIGKMHPFTKIWNIELNKYAAKTAEKCIKLNHLENHVFSIQGDVKKDLPNEKFDRIIMVLPHENHNYLKEAISVAKKGTYIHMYSIQNEEKINSFSKEIEKKYKKKLKNIEKAGDYGPNIWRYCLEYQY